MMPQTTFIDDLLNGDASLEDFDDYVDRWHDSPKSETRELHEYLGLTFAEYEIVFRNPELISDVLIARQDTLPFSSELIY